MHLACEPVRLKQRLAEKVALCNWRSNLLGDLKLIHGRGMKRHKSKQRREGEHHGPMRKGFLLCKIPALCRLRAKLEFELRAGSGHHYCDRLLLQGSCESALARPASRYLIFLIISLVWKRYFRPEPKAFYLVN